jgi:ABC-2 type transport system permease protein
MKSLFKLTFIDLKLYLRNYISTFFTLAFPLLMLLLFGSMYGNQPTPLFEGHGSVDLTIPGYIATIIIGTTAFMSLPMDLSLQRQLGVLRRLRATPLQPGVVLGSKLITNLLVSLLSALLLIGVGVVVFKAVMPANWLVLFLGILLSCMSMYALGFALASLVKSANAVRAVSFVVFYPMMFFSGGTIPSQFLPKAVQDLAKVMPMTYTVNLLHDLYFGKAWDLTTLLVLGGFMTAGVLLSVRFFHWE